MSPRNSHLAPLMLRLQPFIERVKTQRKVRSPFKPPSRLDVHQVAICVSPKALRHGWLVRDIWQTLSSGTLSLLLTSKILSKVTDKPGLIRDFSFPEPGRASPRKSLTLAPNVQVPHSWCNKLLAASCCT